MHWVLPLLYFTTSLLTSISHAADIYANNGIPNCTKPSGDATNLNPVAMRDQLRFAVIAHYSILSTFFHSPEQAARDAAAIVNVDIEWQRHIVNTGETMAQDILDAVDRKVDALIVTIPDEAVYQAVEHAMSKNVPVIVFNSGLQYAQQLGLTRVMQDDVEAGNMLARALHNRNYSRPLCIHISSQNDLDQPVIDNRVQGITSVFGATPTMMTVYKNDNQQQAINTIRQSLKSNEFDSVIAMGGTPTTDLMTEAMFGLDPKDKRIGIGFFDLGSTNRTEIFQAWPDVYGISQLPYIQAALPVFLMHLRVITGYDAYINRTIPTGPTLITKENVEALASKDGSRFLSTPGGNNTTIGTVIPDVQGDTYQSNVIAGMTELARRLGWKIQSSREDGTYGYSDSLNLHMKQFADAGVNGIVLQSSDVSVVNYARNLSQQHSIPLTIFGTFYENPVSGIVDEITSMVNSISFNMTTLTRSIANVMVKDDLKTPTCFQTHTRTQDDFFCALLYDMYQQAHGNASSLPSKENFIHSLNLTTSTAMEVEFETINSTLRAKNYVPDAYITLSEYIFNVMDYSILRGMMYNGSAIYIADSLLDQKEAFLNGRATRVWHLNMYAMGYLAILDILLARSSQYRPWRVVPLDTPIVNTICPAGTYYFEAANFPFCYDENHTAIIPGMQCLLCEPNTYNDVPNQPTCMHCPVGEFSDQGATKCRSCTDDPAAGDNAHCVGYLAMQQERARKTYISVFVPLSIVIFLVLVSLCTWYCWRRHKKRKLIRNQEPENVWLLSYDELMRPSMQHLSSVPSPSLHLSGGTGTSPTIGPLVAPPVRWSSGSERQFILPPHGDINTTTTPREQQQQQQQQRNENRDSLNPNDPALLAGFPSAPISNDVSEDETMPVPVKERLSKDAKDDNQSDHPNDDDQDYFTATSPQESSRLLYYPGKQPKPLRRIIGFHRNLPVFVKQIGFKRLHIDAVAQHELSLMKVARHPKLVEFIGLCLEPEGTFIVEEYCSKGTLYDVVNNPDIGLTWIFKFSLINDLLEGMEFLHRSKFMFHGCLTSQSCFITGRWELKISDYGLDKVRQSQYDPTLMHSLGKQFPQLSRASRILPNHLPGTTHKEDTQPMIIVPHNENLLWLAPESVVCDDSNVCLTKPSRRADAYSVGVIINEIVSRQQPFKKQLEEMSVNEVFSHVEKDYLLPDMAPSEADEYTAKMNMIIAECFRRDPAARPSMTMLRNRIKSIDPHLTGANNNVVDNLATLLEQYANDMENLVRQRTANLQQRTLELEEEKARTQNLLEDLKEAKEVAEAAAASKQNFLANMSHEIRTPMNAVIGMSRILMESNLPADLHDCAETIESSGNHLMAIIDDILDYSKIDSGKLSLEHRRLDLTYVVESALKLVSPNFLDKGIILWYTIEGDVATSVYGDVVRLRQVLLNLLSNALKFTSEGHVCVCVKRLAESPDSSDAYWYESSDNENSEPGCQFSDGASSDVSPTRIETLQVAVKDTGVGIRPEKTSGLFQTFSQVDASTTRNYGGTGLGLAISRRLCRMMGGDMWVESEYGKGSTFYFRVLLREQSSTPTYAMQNRFDDIARLCSYCLVITDSVSQQHCWYNLLTKTTIQRVETLSFADAEKKLQEHDRPDVIIIDEEYEIVPAVDETQATSSKIVLDALRTRNPSIVSIPALYVSDARRRDKVEPSYTTTAPMLLPTKSLAIDSPRDERRNPFDDTTVTTPTADTTGITRVIVKPWKNSKLFAVLLDLLEHKDDTEIMAVESPSVESSNTATTAPVPLTGSNVSAATENTLRIKRRARSNTTASSISSQSSTSSAVPLLSEIASDIRSLLVDDNPVNQKVVARMLSRLGIKPEVAQNGKEACDKIEASRKQGEPIDLVFMDIWMPEMNGLEAAETIRKSLADSSLHPYIIAMTACVMPGDREKCIAAGMNGYVSKPVRKDELEASIHTYTQILVKEMHMFESESDSDDDNRTPTPSSPCTPALLPSVTITSEDTDHIP